MDERQEKHYDLFIGKTIDWTYMFLEYAFKSGNFKGLTGYELEFHTEEESESSLDEIFENGDWYDLYIQYLERERPNDVSYNDWCDMVRDEQWNAYDDGFCCEKCVEDAMDYANEKEGENYEYTNCIACWRHFNEENIKEENYEYFIEENLKLLQKLYKEYEE